MKMEERMYEREEREKRSAGISAEVIFNHDG